MTGSSWTETPALTAPAASAGSGGLDHELAADVVARMLDMADRIRAGLAEGLVGPLSLLAADARLLTEVMPGWDSDDLDEIVGRLWMVAA